MNKKGDVCMWYKGNGVVGMVNCQTLQELRQIEGISGKWYL